MAYDERDLSGVKILFNVDNTLLVALKNFITTMLSKFVPGI